MDDVLDNCYVPTRVCGDEVYALVLSMQGVSLGTYYSTAQSVAIDTAKSDFDCVAHNEHDMAICCQENRVRDCDLTQTRIVDAEHQVVES